MNQSTVLSVIGLRIIGQHGREIGIVCDMHVDTENWQLQSLTVKLNRLTLDDLQLKKPWIGTQIVQIPISEVSGASDTLVLKSPLEEMEFTGGKSASSESRSLSEDSEHEAIAASDRIDRPI